VTICIALICNNGSNAVLVTDSMITNVGLSIEFEHPTKKMTTLSQCCAAMTAGDALADTELFNMVHQEIHNLKSPLTAEVVEKIKDCYQKIRDREIREQILNPRGIKDIGEFYQMQKHLLPDLAFTIQAQIEQYDYGLEIIVAGTDGTKASIYGIENPGTSSCFNAVGFHAIGSGLPHALNTLISRECYPGISLEEAVLVAYEAKKMAERAPGVGTRITNLCIVYEKEIIELEREQIERLDGIYKKWLQEMPKISDFRNDIREVVKKGV